jgi:glycosyltransferase involved in cell wall biosynthesis
LYRLAFRSPDAGVKSEVTYRLSRGLVDREVQRVLRRHGVDVVHVQCVSASARYAMEAASRLQLPLVVTLQGELTMDATGLYERSGFARETLRQCMRGAQVVTACSRKTLEDAEAFLGEQMGARGRVIFNGANVTEFASAEPYRHPQPYLFAIGRCVPQKGFDVLLRSYAAAGVETHDLLIAGDGPERARLETLAAELGLGERVMFLGRADRDKVPSLFKGASIFVLPSRADEGLPVVCAEALAAGCAVIATRSGGTPEAIVEGDTGLLVDKADAKGLCTAIQKLCADASLRERLAVAARARASDFGWTVIAEQYVSAYRAAAAAVAPQNQVMVA